MKRPTFALLSILFLLALGLFATGPKSTDAGSLGELAFAMQIESTDSGDPIVCPMVCCPFVEDDVAETDTDAEPEIALNAAETNEAEDATDHDDEYAYDDYYYDDEYYYDDYGSEYGEEFADVDDTAADEEMELNAPETSENEHISDGCWDEYYGDYAYDYTEFGDDYAVGEAATDAANEVSDCNDACHQPVDLPAADREPLTNCQISPDDLVVSAEEVAHEADPYDLYGHQVDDESAIDDELEPSYEDEYADDYYEDYYYDEYYHEEFETDETAQNETTENATSDEDSLSYEEDYERYYTEEYYEQLEDPATTEAEATYDDEYSDDYYEEYYYDEYYEDDHSYDAEEESVDEAEADWLDDYTSEYDAIYDDAVYGEGIESIESARTDAPSPPVVEDPCGQHAYATGECIDERNADIIDDLPWADEVWSDSCDEVASADVAEIDVPSASTAGEVSEYGSDYAEEYYEAYFDWIEQQEDETVEADFSDEYYEMYFEWVEQQEDDLFHAEAAACEPASPVATAKALRNTFDVTAFATYCGSRVAAMTESLAGLGRAIRTAAIDFDTRSR